MDTLLTVVDPFNTVLDTLYTVVDNVCTIVETLYTVADPFNTVVDTLYTVFIHIIYTVFHRSKKEIVGRKSKQTSDKLPPQYSTTRTNDRTKYLRNGMLTFGRVRATSNKDVEQTFEQGRTRMSNKRSNKVEMRSSKRSNKDAEQAVFYQKTSS